MPVPGGCGVGWDLQLPAKGFGKMLAHAGAATAVPQAASSSTTRTLTRPRRTRRRGRSAPFRAWRIMAGLLPRKLRWPRADPRGSC